MTDQEFTDLCQTLAASLPVPDSGAMSEPGEFFVDGYRFGLFFDPERDRMDCYLDLGFIDEGKRLEVFGRLLELNLEVDGLHGEAIGFDGDTGHLVLRSAIRTEFGCEADQLRQLFAEYAEFADDLTATLLSRREKTATQFVGGIA